MKEEIKDMWNGLDYACKTVAVMRRLLMLLEEPVEEIDSYIAKSGNKWAREYENKNIIEVAMEVVVDTARLKTEL